MGIRKIAADRKRGASLLGYGLVIGLISVVALVSTTNVGSQVDTLFTDVSDSLGGASDAAGSGQGGETPTPGPSASPSPTPIMLSGSGVSNDPFIWGDGTTEAVCAGYLAASDPYDYAGAPGGDGVYQIDPDGPNGDPSFPVFCDMTTEGGGWTRLGYQASNTSGFFAGNYAAVTGGGTIMQNWTGASNTMVGSDTVPSGYLGQFHYLLLDALGDVSFSEVLLDDNHQVVSTQTGGSTSLNSIFNANSGPSGRVLSRSGSNYGLMMLQGSSGQTGAIPCYYMNATATGCETVFTGDTGNRTALFLVVYHGNCTFQTSTTLIWGSSDCYATDQYGGTFATQVYRELGNNSRLSGGRNNGPTAIFIR
ncbi:MAG: hypothetical protein Alpg2KO_19310 [Alphaproteobacteria bacterium]